MITSNLITVNKPVGMTPLEVIKLLKSTSLSLTNIKMGYAGRLDPMAEGLLIILLDEENKNKHTYENLDKTYECEILLGISTDTYDLMGIMTDQIISDNKKIQSIPTLHGKIQKILREFEGTQIQQYPPYSSVRVKGHPLYYWSRRNLLHTITTPTRQIHIDSLCLLSQSTIDYSSLIEAALSRISKVNGNFRQQEIIQLWQTLKPHIYDYPILKIRVECSSGTYIRSIAENFGKRLGVPSLAFSIKRTRIGPFKLAESELVG